MISNAAEPLDSVSFATMLFWLLPAGARGVSLCDYQGSRGARLRVTAEGYGVEGRHLTPTSVELEIFRKGASAILNRLYRRDSEWDAVLSGVASGTAEWLQAVKRLYSVSDGGTAEPGSTSRLGVCLTWTSPIKHAH